MTRSPTRRSRPLLRAAAIGAGAMLIGVGSAACSSGDDGTNLPGNPKGSHYDDGASKDTEGAQPMPGNPKGSHYDDGASTPPADGEGADPKPPDGAKPADPAAAKPAAPAPAKPTP